MKLNILDLFSGSGGWINAWIKTQSFDISIDSIDIDNKFPHVNLCMDIRDFKPTKKYQIVYASPPCQKFSQMRRINKNKISKEELEESIELSNLAFQYAHKAELCYIIENPYTGTFKNYHKDEKYQIVDYSMYGYPMRKRTAIWSNITFNFKIQTAPQYNKYPLSYLSEIEKIRIPENLSRYVKWKIIKVFNKELQKYKFPYRL